MRSLLLVFVKNVLGLLLLVTPLGGADANDSFPEEGYEIKYGGSGLPLRPTTSGTMNSQLFYLRGEDREEYDDEDESWDQDATGSSGLEPRELRSDPAESVSYLEVNADADIVEHRSTTTSSATAGGRPHRPNAASFLEELQTGVSASSLKPASSLKQQHVRAPFPRVVASTEHVDLASLLDRAGGDPATPFATGAEIRIPLDLDLSLLSAPQRVALASGLAAGARQAVCEALKPVFLPKESGRTGTGVVEHGVVLAARGEQQEEAVRRCVEAAARNGGPVGEGRVRDDTRISGGLVPWSALFLDPRFSSTKFDQEDSSTHASGDRSSSTVDVHLASKPGKNKEHEEQERAPPKKAQQVLSAPLPPSSLLAVLSRQADAPKTPDEAVADLLAEEAADEEVSSGFLLDDDRQAAEPVVTVRIPPGTSSSGVLPAKKSSDSNKGIGPPPPSTAELQRHPDGGASPYAALLPQQNALPVDLDDWDTEVGPKQLPFPSPEIVVAAIADEQSNPGPDDPDGIPDEAVTIEKGPQKINSPSTTTSLVGEQESTTSLVGEESRTATAATAQTRMSTAITPFTKMYDDYKSYCDGSAKDESGNALADPYMYPCMFIDTFQKKAGFGPPFRGGGGYMNAVSYSDPAGKQDLCAQFLPGFGASTQHARQFAGLDAYVKIGSPGSHSGQWKRKQLTAVVALLDCFNVAEDAKALNSWIADHADPAWQALTNRHPGLLTDILGRDHVKDQVMTDAEWRLAVFEKVAFRKFPQKLKQERTQYFDEVFWAPFYAVTK